MDRLAVVKLIDQQHAEGGIGQQKPVETAREVFCQVASVSREELADAGQRGLQARRKVTVFTPDYAGEEVAELEGVRYGIYRTYMAAGERLELYLERKVGV